MKKINIKLIILSTIAATFFSGRSTGKKLTVTTKPPRLIVVFIVDQFAYFYLEKLNKYLKHGIKFLLDNGVVYKNAYQPHAYPTTPAGHSAISTGAFPEDHGMAIDYWFDYDGNKIYCEKSYDSNAQVFSKDGFYNYSKSAKKLMANTLSNNFILQSKTTGKNRSFAISFKSRASISLAGHNGKAIWFDYKTGYFTSSKAYFDKFPKWLTGFNKENKMDQLKITSWNLFYNKKNHAYDFKYIKDYRFCEYNFSLIEQPQKINFKKEKPFNIYVKTPHANKLLLNLSQRCIDSNLSKNKQDRFLLWISLSSLDTLGHSYGPHSMEVIDMIYHLDKQLGDFIDYAQKKVGPQNVLFAFTSDHGVCPIPEILKEQGYKNAIRILEQPLIEKINNIIEKKYGIEKIIVGFKKTHLFINNKKLNALKKNNKEKISDTIKKFFQNIKGIKNVWTNKDLDTATFDKTQLEYFFKKQRYTQRTGDLILQTKPYVLLTKKKTGAWHMSPYEYDTHVPLILYQKGKYFKKVIDEKVFVTQLPVTIAKILDIQKPSASTFDVLPGIF